jgi:ParB family transcriptional regulator, chromosome partitioning protein
MDSKEAAMADDAARSRLGRGLAALIGDVGAESQGSERVARSTRKVPIEFVRANPRNPRKNFSEAELEELAASIGKRGIIQPIVVRARGADYFEIIAGERRWRAAQRTGLHEVPVVVIEASDAEALELAIIENVQRADLNPIEEAAGYQSLLDEFNHSQDELATIVGKSRSHIANTLRLLKLSEAIKAHVRSGKLSAGHARALIGQPNAEELAEQIITRGLNVRQVENMARRDGKAQARFVYRTGALNKDADTEALEKRLTDALGLRVTIEHRPTGRGTLRVSYGSLEQLDDVVKRLETDSKPAAGTWPPGKPRIRSV